jgi:lipopolysaccharide export system permease protein
MMKLLVYNMAWMVALVIPMSVLVASVMAFGRMGADGEIVAMKAAGISMYRIVAPLIVIVGLLSIGMVWFNNELLPEANYRAKTLTVAIAKSTPMFQLKNREGQFVSAPNGAFTIKVNEINKITEEMYGVTLFRQEGNIHTIIMSEKGEFTSTEGGLVLNLTNGEIHRKDPSKSEQYIRSKFEKFVYILKDFDTGMGGSLIPDRSDRTKTSAMLKQEVENLKTSLEAEVYTFKKELTKSSPDRHTIAVKQNLIRHTREQISMREVEIHKKNSIPFAALIFVFIGAAMGILVKRSGASIGIGISIGFIMLYYLFLIGGESAGDHLIIPAWFAMWAPNILLGPVGLAMFIYAARR